MGGKRGRVFRNNYKGHMDKTKGGGIRRKMGMTGVGSKCRQLYLNNNKKNFLKKSWDIPHFTVQ